jgi:hypothetical protein
MDHLLICTRQKLDQNILCKVVIIFLSQLCKYNSIYKRRQAHDSIALAYA